MVRCRCSGPQDPSLADAVIFASRKIMPSNEYDLGYLKSAIDVLEEYLLSDEIYWATGSSPPLGDPPYPQLTLGGVLLAQARLKARQDAGKMVPELDRLVLRLDTIFSKWKVAWNKKASREYISRLNLWRDFLEELRTNPEDNYDRYSYEVTRRVMLHLLEPFAVHISVHEKELLTGLDKLLEAMFASDGFIWEESIEPGFSRADYWYLYGHLRVSQRQ